MVLVSKKSSPVSDSPGSLKAICVQLPEESQIRNVVDEMEDAFADLQMRWDDCIEAYSNLPENNCSYLVDILSER